jgi:hypothetical protein
MQGQPISTDTPLDPHMILAPRNTSFFFFRQGVAVWSRPALNLELLLPQPPE